MFSKNSSSTSDQEPTTPSMPKPQPVQRPAVVSPAVPAAAQDMSSSLSPGMTVIGKLVGEGAVKIYGRIEGELEASNIVICEGAQIDGDVVAKELTIAGRVKARSTPARSSCRAVQWSKAISSIARLRSKRMPGLKACPVARKVKAKGPRPRPRKSRTALRPTVRRRQTAGRRTRLTPRQRHKGSAGN